MEQYNGSSCADYHSFKPTAPWWLWLLWLAPVDFELLPGFFLCMLITHSQCVHLCSDLCAKYSIHMSFIWTSSKGNCIAGSNEVWIFALVVSITVVALFSPLVVVCGLLADCICSTCPKFRNVLWPIAMWKDDRARLHQFLSVDAFSNWNAIIEATVTKS